MRELNHNTLSYAGNPKDGVTIRVERQETNQIVSYTLNGGASQNVLDGENIAFALSDTVGAEDTLQLNLDFTANGSYTVVVENVTGCIKDTGHKNECSHTRPGPVAVTMDFTFLVE